LAGITPYKQARSTISQCISVRKSDRR